MGRVSLQNKVASGTKKWRADVYVTLKPVVNDPQGLAVRDGLHMLGYDEVDAVRAGKYIQLWLDAEEEAQAEARVNEMCDKLLANPVIEQYRFNLVEQPSDGSE
jgi:phosphoribosylformylglycinamidine synthase PurS subunit